MTEKQFIKKYDSGHNFTNKEKDKLLNFEKVSKKEHESAGWVKTEFIFKVDNRFFSLFYLDGIDSGNIYYELYEVWPHRIETIIYTPEK